MVVKHREMQVMVRGVLRVFVLLFAIIGASHARAQTVVYVHPGAAPGGDGSSWGRRIGSCRTR